MQAPFELSSNECIFAETKTSGAFWKNLVSLCRYLIIYRLQENKKKMLANAQGEPREIPISFNRASCLLKSQIQFN